MTNATTGKSLVRRSFVLGCMALVSLVLLPLFDKRGEATAALNDAQKKERALEFITQHGTAMVAIMASDSMPKREKRLKLKVILEENLDLQTMMRAIVGPYWREMNEPQRERYQNASSQWVLLYASSLLITIKPSQLEVLVASPLGKDVLVETELLDKGNPQPFTLHWRVRFTPNDEAILIDMHFRGLSMVAAQRNEVSALLSEQGVSAFLDKLDERLEKIKLEFNKN